MSTLSHVLPPTCSGTPEPVTGNLFVAAYPPFSCWTAEAVGEVSARLLNPRPAIDKTPLGMYLHLPFCADRCHYCYYRSYAHQAPQAIDRYLDAVLEEAALYADSPAVAGRQFRFAYFGGGTPSILSERQIHRLFRGLWRVFSWDSVEEITFECAPQTVSREKLLLLRDAGVTRLSMGVQQMNDTVLRQNGRVHLVADVHRAFKEIEAVGFPIVNLDLIVGMVDETAETFARSLRDVIALRPDSITMYQLEIPRNTRLFRALQAADAPLVPTWDEKRSRVEWAFAELEQAGYTPRSAYAAVRDPDRHWFLYQDEQYHGADLIGLGLTSFSYFDGVHYQNCTAMSRYLLACAEQRWPHERAYRLSDEERLVREFVLQLKLGNVETAYFSEKFAVDVLTRFAGPLVQCAARGWLTYDAAAIRLTSSGRAWTDRMLPVFYLPAHREAAYW